MHVYNLSKSSRRGASAVLLFAIVLLAVLLLPGGPAWADVTVGGGVDVGFGQLDREASDTTSFEASGTAYVSLGATLGAFEFNAAIGVIDDAAVDYTEHEAIWHFTDQASLTLSGSAFGVPGVDGFLGIVAGEGTGKLGNLDVYFDYSDAGLANLNFGTDGFTVGVAVSDTCVPECGHDGAGNNADQQRNTYIATARGQGVPLAWQAYYAISRGRFSANRADGNGSGGGLSLGYETDTLRVALDVASGTIACATAFGCTGASDIALTNAGVAVVVQGFGVQYVSLEEDAGAGAKTETTGVDVVYHVVTEEGVTFGPQYSQETVDSGTTSTTDSYLYFVISAAF